MDDPKTSVAPVTIDPAEFSVLEKEAAKAETETTEGAYVHVFRKPFTYENKTYETLTFDFAKLTGRDALAIQDELDAQGKAVLVKQMNDNYLLRVAVRACTTPIGTDVLSAAPLVEFNKIMKQARSFLLRSGL